MDTWVLFFDTHGVKRLTCIRVCLPHFRITAKEVMNLFSQLKLVRYSRHLIVIALVVMLLTPAYLLAMSLGKPSPAQAADPGSLSFNAFNTGTAKVAGVPFLVTIRASNSSFSETVALSDGSGSVSPARTDNFVNGVWTGAVELVVRFTEFFILKCHS